MSTSAESLEQLLAEEPVYDQPALPASLKRLSTAESAYLRSMEANRWSNPQQSCRTCGKQTASKDADLGGVYRWYRPGSRNPADIILYRCNCAAQFRLFQWMGWAGIGLNYQRIAWEDGAKELLTSPTASAVMQYAANSQYHVNAGSNLILHSKVPGTGKTFLASLLTKRLLLEGMDPYFTTFNAMLNLYTGGWGNDDLRARFDRRVRGAEFLVIDDLGREYPGRFPVAAYMLEEVLRARTASCMPTAVTTNLDDKEMTVYGKNLLSLLEERAIKLEVNGQDKRPHTTQRAALERELGLSRPIVVG